jgi:YbbR domain-containing protein
MEKLVRQIIEKVSSFRRPKNWVLKLVSLFFALFLWYFVVGEDKVDMNVTIPVEIVNLPRDLVISNQYKKQIEVTVSGQRSLIRGMSEQHINRSVDLSKAAPGTVVVQNHPDSISLPRGLNILRVQPPTITLLLDQLIQKELPIKPILVGKVHKDFRLDSVTVDPPKLEISGPRSILDQEENVSTSPIDINGLNQSTVKQIPLALKPEISDLIGEPIVAVRLSISELREKMEISNIQVDFELDNGRQTETIYRLHPSTVSITADIPQGMIRQPDSMRDLFKAQIAPKSLQPGRTDLAVNIKGPPEIKILEIKPKTVTLEITGTQKLKIRP